MAPDNKKLKTALAWGIGLLGLAVAAPAIWMAVSGLIGLAVAGAIVAAGTAVVGMAPLAASWLANMKLKGIKFIASKNPVEQLQNIFIERKQALIEFGRRITDFATQVRQFEDKMRVFATQYPTEAPKFKAQLDAMYQLMQLRKERFAEVSKQLDAFELEVKKADAIWQMSQAAAELNKAAGMESDDIFAKIKAETAVESIQLSLNRSFAELELALMEESQAKPAAPSASPLSQPQPTLTHNPQPVMLQGTTSTGRVRPLSQRA